MSGGKMKTTGTIETATGLWYSPNRDATNSSGFSGTPGGFRNNNGGYGYIGNLLHWWSSSEVGADFALSRYLGYSGGSVLRVNSNVQAGFSVRCPRD